MPCAGILRDAARPLLAFTVALVLSAMLLQRIGLPAGAKNISIVGPIGVGLAALGLLRGTLSFSRVRLTFFLLLCVCAAGGLVYHATQGNSFTAEPSMQSLLQFLVMTGFATLSFAYPVPERRFFRAVTACLAVAAAAGLLQFAAQFVGLRLFSFRGIVPDMFLYEDGYNQIIPIGFGGLLKSNGFFMDEPSIFSQFMAIGLIIEILTARRAQLLALFAAGLLTSASGTGWIVLTSFVLTAAFSMGVRGIALSLATGILAAALVLGVATALPDLAAALSDRLNEVARPGTSGHMRFVTPFWLFGDVFAFEPVSLILGLGAGVSERLTLPYEYDVNTPVKIALEFGLPALLAYVGVLAAGAKTAVQRTLLAPGLVMLLFAGGYQQFPPVLFPLVLILSVARLTPSP